MSKLTKEVIEIAEELLEYSEKSKTINLPPNKAIEYAIEIQRNNIFEEAFGLGIKDEPAYLEAIAIQLGFNGNGKTHINVPEAFIEIANAIRTR